jgi:hypothetical protein
MRRSGSRSNTKAGRWLIAIVSGLLACGTGAWAGAIDTNVIEGVWPKQKSRVFEVGRHEINWRQAATKEHGVRVGATFTAPLPVDRVWAQSGDYSKIGTMTPGVKAVRRTPISPGHEMIELDAKVLWKTITLKFEVEQDAPRATRFRLADERLGEYLGVCLYEAAGPEATRVQMITSLKPAVSVPLSLLMLVQRRVFLVGIRNFLEACDKEAKQRTGAAPQP